MSDEIYRYATPIGPISVDHPVAGLPEIVAETSPARVEQMVAEVLAIAADLDDYAQDFRPEKLPMSERKLAAALRVAVAPGLDPAMNDGWTLRTLTSAMREFDSALAERGIETGSIGDGPYPPWEVALAEIDRLRASRTADDEHVAARLARADADAAREQYTAAIADLAEARREVERLHGEVGKIVDRIRDDVSVADHGGSRELMAQYERRLRALLANPEPDTEEAAK